MENSKSPIPDPMLRPVRPGETAWCRCKAGVHSVVVTKVQGSITTVERDGWKGNMHIKRLHRQWADAFADGAPKGEDDGPVIATPPEPESPKQVEAQPMSPAVQGLANALDMLADADPEMVDGARVDKIASECVDLDVEFSPVVPCRCDDWQHNPPTPSRVTKGQDGRYWVDDLQQYVHVESVKIMRARYLLMRGWFWKQLRAMSHSDRQRVLSMYFEGGTWQPEEGSELAKAMHVV